MGRGARLHWTEEAEDWLAKRVQGCPQTFIAALGSLIRFVSSPGSLICRLQPPAKEQETGEARELETKAFVIVAVEATEAQCVALGEVLVK